MRNLHQSSIGLSYGLFGSLYVKTHVGKVKTLKMNELLRYFHLKTDSAKKKFGKWPHQPQKRQTSDWLKLNHVVVRKMHERNACVENKNFEKNNGGRVN